MSNSYGNSLTRVVYAILEDCMDIFPGDRQELLRDFARLSFLVERRGLALYTLDLPALGKHFDRCLSEGTYTKPNLPISGVRWNGKPIPKLFSGLVLRVFTRDGMLRFNADVNAIAALRQLYNFSKKLRIDCERRKHYDAVQTFVSIESDLPEPTLNWAEPWSLEDNLNRISFCDVDSLRDRRLSDSHGCRTRHDLHATLQQVADRVATSLGEFSPGEWRPKHGPGAVSDQKQGENKYAFPTWTEKLDFVFPFAEFAFANLGLWSDIAIEQGGAFDDEPSSKLISVPKTQKGPRLIAAEPVSHQWCQQIIWDYLEQRVRDSFLGRLITFRDQTNNQVLARVASETGSHWTVDLSSASDYLSLWCVERLFRRNPALLTALCASRTRFLSQDIDKKAPKMLELKKFSTMGSACTFPVQSIFFATCVITAILHSRGLKCNTRNILMASAESQVFGDDIIVPGDSGEVLAMILGDLGFRINPDKTFRTGRFRESCGVEAFEGYDVTPAYVTNMASIRRPESVLATVEQSNNFFLKGWWRASSALRQTVAVGPWPVVHASLGVVGWKSFCGSKPTNKKRWNEELQRDEHRSMQLTTHNPVTPTDDWTALLQFFTEDPDPELSWVSGTRQRPRLKLRRAWVADRDLLS